MLLIARVDNIGTVIDYINCQNLIQESIQNRSQQNKCCHYILYRRCILWETNFTIHKLKTAKLKAHVSAVMEDAAYTKVSENFFL